MTRTTAMLTALLLAGMLAMTACRKGPAPDTRVAAAASPERPQAAADSVLAIVNARGGAGGLPTVMSERVESWTGPGNRPFEIATRTSEGVEVGHARRFGSITLPTALRTRPLGQYPCTSCHLGRKLVMTEKRTGDAHQNVQPVHPQQTGARCATCHAPDNVEFLALENGGRATLDESYRLCADCHFSQVSAWAHGAHGKRLDSWQGRRVVMACPDCHDPHNPALEPRIPFRAPQIERARSHDP
jgi:hypothetical protein